MLQKIEIEKTDNGWILTYFDEYEDTGLPYSRKKVFSFDEDDIDTDEELREIKALEKMLWEVNEQVGIRYNKHRKYNINIEVN